VDLRQNYMVEYHESQTHRLLQLLVQMIINQIVTQPLCQEMLGPKVMADQNGVRVPWRPTSHTYSNKMEIGPN